jgi:hypothetical protein
MKRYFNELHIAARPCIARTNEISEKNRVKCFKRIINKLRLSV